MQLTVHISSPLHLYWTHTKSQFVSKMCLLAWTFTALFCPQVTNSLYLGLASIDANDWTPTAGPESGVSYQ